MPDQSPSPKPQDVCLLLRAHGEEHLLVARVLPVLRQLEEPVTIPDDQFEAALAYLEVLWLDACRRAALTDAAYARLDVAVDVRDRALHEKARRYHAAVRRLRATFARRVAERTSSHAEAPAYGLAPR